MKVRISFTVNVDTEEWQENYGEMTPAEIREDVRSYIEQSAYASGSGAIHAVPESK